FVEGVFRDGHHGVVELRHQAVAGREEHLALVGLGSGLVEALAQVLAIEADEVDDGLRRDADRLARLQIEREAGVARKLALPQHDVSHAKLSWTNSFRMERRVEDRLAAGAFEIAAEPEL